MDHDIYKMVIEKTNRSYACSEIIFDNKNKAIDWIFLDLNHAFEKTLKVSSDSLIGKKASSVISPQSSEFKKIIQLVNQAIIEQKTKESDYFSSLLKRYFHISVFTVKDNKFVMLINQISKMVKYFNLYEEKYNSIINHMVEHIWVLDLDFNFTYLLPTLEQYSNYKIDDFSHLKEIFTEESFIKAQEEMQEIIFLYEKGKLNPYQTFKFIAEEKRPGGKIAIVEHSFQLLIDDSDTPYAFIGLGRDITEQQKDKNRLHASEEMLRLILNSTAEGIFGTDQNGNCTFINQSGLKMLGYQHQREILGKNIQNLICPSHFDNECPFDEVLNTGDEYHAYNSIFIRADKTLLNVEFYAFPQIKDDTITGSVVTFFDITDRLKVQEKLKESERSKSVLLANLPGMAFRCKFDKDWTMEFVSDGCYELTGYKKESLIFNKEISFNEIVKKEYRNILWNKWQEVTSTYEVFSHEYIIVTADGTEKWVLEQGQAVHDDEGNIIALEGMITDINDIKNKQKEIEYLLYHDSLTGLYNRRYFEDIKAELDSENNLPLTIMYSDINGLKLINDAFGHTVGDELIIDTSKVINECCREGDIVARIGGDEFALILPRTEEEEAYEMMMMILKKLDQTNTNYTNEKYHISLSIGFGTKKTMKDDLVQVQKLAEDFMYRRKLLERNSFHNSLILSIQSTMYEKSQETEQHAERLMHLSSKLGQRLGLTQAELDQLSLLSALHDIGKIIIPDSILQKPGKLTLEEWEEIKKHPLAGYRIAMAIPELISIADFILCHHEHWDGKGYPQGLIGEEIPFLSRILSVIDAFDAMTEYRSYRKPLTLKEALTEIKVNAGTQFDPKIAEEFLKMMEDS